jgi:hypothetical protein
MKHPLKILVLALVAFLTTVFAHADNSYSNAVAALSPVAYWPLNETTQPPAPYVATNIGTLGAKGNAYYGNAYYTSGTGFNLMTLFGGPTNGVTSDGNSAAQFNGGANGDDNSEYLIIPQVDKNLTFGVPFSAEAWVKPGGGDPNDLTGASFSSTEWTGIIKKGGGGAFYTENGDVQGNTYGWTIGMAGCLSLGNPVGWYEPGTTFLRTNAVFVVDFYNGASGNAPSLELMVPFQEPTPAWFHLVLTYDGTNANFYTNGVLAATTVPGLPQSTNNVIAPGQGAFTSATGAYVFSTVNGVGYAQDTINPICIGNINESFSFIASGYPNTPFGTLGFNCQNFNGAMDEVAVYTNSLSAAAVLKHYQDATASDHTLYTNDVRSAAPIVYLRMDEPVYTQPPADFSTYPPAVSYGSMTGANGLIQPGSIPGISGPVVSGFGNQSSAVQLNGFDAAVDVGNGGLFGTALDPQGSQAFSVAYWFKANPSDCYGRFQTILGRGDQGWRSSIDNNGNLRWNPGHNPEISSPQNYNDGVWHQVVGVSDGTTASLYVDGQLSTSAGGVGTLAGSSLDLLIGGAVDYTTSDRNVSQQRYFAGQIAQVAFFNTALTGPQIQTLYFAAEVAPFITQQPKNITLGLGSTGSLSVTSGGSPTLAYQWYQGTNKLTDSGNISGSTTSNLTITSTVTNNAGNYSVVVTNSFGSTTSQVAVVSVSLAPNILAQPSPSSVTRYAGNQVSFSVGVVGASPFSFQWYKGSTPIGGATTSNLVLTAVAGSNSYSVRITNSFGFAISSSVSVIGSVFAPSATGGFTLNFAVAPNSVAANVYVGQGAYSDSTNNVWNPFPGGSGTPTGLAFTSSSNQTLVTATLIFGFNNGLPNAAITNGNPSWLVSYEDAVNSGNPGIGTADAPMGQITLQNVPQGPYQLYLYGQNYDGNRGSVFALAPVNGGIPDNGLTGTVNTQPATKPAVLIEGDNYVFFRGVTPDPSGTITVTYIPNPAGTLTGEAPFNGLQLVGAVVSVKSAGNGNITITWSGGTLVSSSQLGGPYNPVAGTSPLTMQALGPVQYFRVQE